MQREPPGGGTVVSHVQAVGVVCIVWATSGRAGTLAVRAAVRVPLRTVPCDVNTLLCQSRERSLRSSNLVTGCVHRQSVVHEVQHTALADGSTAPRMAACGVGWSAVQVWRHTGTHLTWMLLYSHCRVPGAQASTRPAATANQTDTSGCLLRHPGAARGAPLGAR